MMCAIAVCTTAEEEPDVTVLGHLLLSEYRQVMREWAHVPFCRGQLEEPTAEEALAVARRSWYRQARGPYVPLARQ